MNAALAETNRGTGLLVLVSGEAGIGKSSLIETFTRRPGIVVFEDVHWADEATLGFLRYIGQRVSQTSALLVITYRDDELGSQHHLRILLGDLATTNDVRHMTLKPLSVKAVRALVGNHAVDAEVPHRHTGGNPFFITKCWPTRKTRSQAQFGMPYSPGRRGYPLPVTPYWKLPQ